MSNREKLILVIMLLAVVYGIYELLFSGTPNRTAQETVIENAELQDLQTRLNAEIKVSSLSASERAVLARAESKWGRDPFLGTSPKPTRMGPDRAAIAIKDGSLSYTGFVEVGKQRLAIINGLEYEENEELESGAFLVKDIEPRKVLLERKGSKEIYSVPFTGDIFMDQAKASKDEEGAPKPNAP